MNQTLGILLQCWPMRSRSRAQFVHRCPSASIRELLIDILNTLSLRGDISGALSVVLEHAPYGPNVEDAKVRYVPCALLGRIVLKS